MSQPASPSKKPGKFYLKAPPSIMPGQSYSYTEPTPRGEVRFVLPGAKQKGTGMCPRPMCALAPCGLTSHIV